MKTVLLFGGIFALMLVSLILWSCFVFAVVYLIV